jgi:hypothetical protein
MRLLNTRTLELEYFPKGEKPPYAILSHTWGTEEVLFEDVRHGSAKLRSCPKKGLAKVLKSAELALADGYDYVWIDACCIDKSSSAELSEAINSMFAWYRQSGVCYAFLEDYTHGRSALADSRWFTRGWTLQELIAPFEVRFYDSSWVMFGDRLQLALTISHITSIDHHLLSFKFTPTYSCTNGHGHPPNCAASCTSCRDAASARLLRSYSVSNKMAWAACRETTRVEDIAYCLMGIFDVNMPLLYGEGMKAFRRLQEEIVRHSNDQTILTWTRQNPWVEIKLELPQSRQYALFASHPAQFRSGNLFQPIHSLMDDHSINVSSAGIEIEVHIAPCQVQLFRGMEIRPPNLETQTEQAWLAVLSCSHNNDIFSSPALVLERAGSDHWFSRRCFSYPFERYQYFVISESGTVTSLRANAAALSQKPSVTFDPAQLDKRRIMLREPETATAVPLPKARFSLKTSPSLPWYRLERCAAPDSSPTLNADRNGTSLPLWWGSQKDRGLYNKLVYGAACVSDGVTGGLFVLWGVWYPKDHTIALAFTDPVGWRSSDAHLFCEIYSISDHRTMFDKTLEDHRWISKLAETVPRHNEVVARIPPDTSKASLATCQRLLGVGNTGETVQVVAKLSTREFLGRSMVHIHISLEPQRQ